MSLQWTFIATVLYSEIALVVLLMLPFLSASTWQKLFRSRMIAAFRSHASLYFNVFVCLLLVLFFDSIREMLKYQKLHDSTEVKSHDMAKTSVDMKMFRSQRNFYITGFSMLLWLVLRRLVTLISTQAKLTADCEAAQKQAKSASEAAKKFMEESENKTNEDRDSKELEEQLEKKKADVKMLREELIKTEANLSAMKKQAQATNTEYDRLLNEHSKLQETVKSLEGKEESKKDD